MTNSRNINNSPGEEIILGKKYPAYKPKGRNTVNSKWDVDGRVNVIGSLFSDRRR